MAETLHDASTSLLIGASLVVFGTIADGVEEAREDNLVGGVVRDLLATVECDALRLVGAGGVARPHGRPVEPVDDGPRLLATQALLHGQNRAALPRGQLELPDLKSEISWRPISLIDDTGCTNVTYATGYASNRRRRLLFA